MSIWLKILLTLFVFIPLALIILHTIIRIIRHIYRFPIPQALTRFIDGPHRHRFQPPDATAVRHGIEPGMKVMDVGPGNGSYTIAAARLAGPDGTVYAVDIDQKIIERLNQRINDQGVDNLIPMVADVYELPFSREEFDLIYLITVIGEIPEPVKAMREFHRVLKPEGRLVFSELLVDADYPSRKRLVQLASESGFREVKRLGNFFYYTLIFEKDG